MVAFGLLDIPPEIQLQIAEFARTNRTLNTLKALSLTSRSLRSIAQSVLFQELHISLDKQLWGSIYDLLANSRICAAIRSLSLRKRSSVREIPHHSNEKRLSLIAKLLPEMVGLAEVGISGIYTSKVFMGVLLEKAASTPLKVNLRYNMYPTDINPTPHTPLRISHLTVSSVHANHANHGFFRSVLRASTTTLTKLNVRLSGDSLMELADIVLPFLHDFTLFIVAETEVSRTSAAAFITAQKTIRKLELKGTLGPFPALSPDALPDLRELIAPTELVNQLVPGRPVEAIEVSSQKRGQDCFGEEVTRSTARVRKLQVRFSLTVSNARMMNQMVQKFPFLERLSFSVLGVELLEVIEVLTSFKYLTYLSVSLACYEGRANYNVDAIATKLRKANSCFSSIEIWNYDLKRLKYTASVWNEVFGVFRHVEIFHLRT